MSMPHGFSTRRAALVLARAARLLAAMMLSLAIAIVPAPIQGIAAGPGLLMPAVVAAPPRLGVPGAAQSGVPAALAAMNDSPPADVPAVAAIATSPSGGGHYAASSAAIVPAAAGDTPTDAPTPTGPNPIQVENALPGTSNWQITKQTNSSHVIEGYASRTSVNKGGQIDFYVNVSPAATFGLEVFRMGWYGGAGARLMQSVTNLAGVAQPACPMDSGTGMVACAWAVSYTLAIPPTWTTGVYLVRMTRADGYQNYLMFVVRDDGSAAAYLFQSGVTTFQAYNDWGGKSLYGALTDRSNTALRAYQVSFDRPYVADRGPVLFLNWEYQMVRWLERGGYDVAYATDVDTHESAAMLLQHRAFLSVGHDEYWSKAMRANVEAALAAGVNLGFFGANAVYWNIRLSDSAIGSDRVMTCYKDAQLDPLTNVDNTNVTVRWRDAPLNRPENALIGEMYSGFYSGKSAGYPMVVTNAASWVYGGVDVTANSALPNVVGYEWDKVFNNGASPPGLSVLAQSPVVDVNGNADVSNVTVYTAPSGATVFAAGSIQWADSLDNFIEGGVQGLDSRVQAITANVLGRLGQAPGSAPIAPPATPPAGPNLVTNGSFEVDDGSWQLTAQAGGTAEATWWEDGSTAADGAASAHIQVYAGTPGGAPSVQLGQQVGALAGGQTYTLRFWGRASALRTVTATVKDGAVGAILTNTGLTLSANWQNYEFTFQAASDIAQPTLTFSLDPTVAGDVWLDGVELVVGQPAQPLVGLPATGAKPPVITGWALQTIRASNYLKGITCPTATTCYAVGDNGSILATTNGGAAWTAQSSPATTTLYSVACPSPSTCFAVGVGGAIETTGDGGATWTAQSSGATTTLYGASCPSLTTCFIAGINGAILVTTDGGTTWTAQSSGTSSYFYGLTCPSQSTCFAVGGGGTIRVTTNGGTTWSGQGSGVTSSLRGIACPSATTCYAIGDGGAIVATTDGGAHWVRQSSPSTANLRGISCSAGGICYAVGDGGVILATTTGGSLWSRQSSGATSNLLGMSCGSLRTCTGAGDTGAIVATTNGGASWSAQSSGTVANLRSIACPSVAACYAVGDGGVILATSNGGATWVAQTSGITASLKAVACPAGGACYAVGDSGAILATTNGGATWSAQASGTAANLRGIACPGVSACYATGDGGAILTTADGVTWSAQVSGTATNLDAVACPGVSACYATGDGGAILATTNGGATWASQASGTTQALYGMACASTSICYAAGGSGTVLTIQSGDNTSWSHLTAGTTAALRGMACSAVGICTLVGDSGAIRSTTDGISWYGQSAPTTNGLKGIACPDQTTCYAVGDGGVILAIAIAPPQSPSPTPTVTGTPGSTATATPTPGTASSATATSTAAPPQTATPAPGGWVRLASGSGAYLKGVGCAGAASCYAVGDGGTIVATTNGGTSWSGQSSGVTVTLYAVACPSAACVIAGITGAILSTSNAGATWSVGNSGTGNTLYGVACTGPSACIAAGISGAILATTDGGATWSTRSSGTSSYFYGLTCAGATCFAVGGGGVIRVTTNSGSSWSGQSSTTTNALRAVTCPSGTVCYAVGDGGTIVATVNGGATWSTQSSGGAINLKGVACTSVSACYAVGDGGAILATTNGGATWAAQASGTTANLKAVTCPAGGACYAVGDSGAILRH